MLQLRKHAETHEDYDTFGWCQDIGMLCQENRISPHTGSAKGEEKSL